MIKRTCSKPASFEKGAKESSESLVARGHKRKFVSDWNFFYFLFYFFFLLFLSLLGCFLHLYFMVFITLVV